MLKDRNLFENSIVDTDDVLVAANSKGHKVLLGMCGG